MKAIQFNRTGGPDVLEYVDIDLPPPGAGEVRVIHEAIGANFGEAYFRSGLYGTPKLPSCLGAEAAGVVDSVGPGVAGFTSGDRVAYGDGQLCSYAEAANVPAGRLVRIPEGLNFEQAATIAKGLTVHMLIRQVYKVAPGDTIMVHAAAGAVGSIACQWATSLGARVIGGVGSAAKVDLARRYGCDEVVVVSEDGWPAKIRDLTGGLGVDVVFDGNGNDTFLPSLDCLRRRGMMVSFGNASGPVAPVAPLTLMMKGSLSLARPFLSHFIDTPEDNHRMGTEYFDVLVSGAVKLDITQRFPLAQARQVHDSMLSRSRTGVTVMIP